MNETNNKKRVKTNFVFIFAFIAFNEFFCNPYRVCINTEFCYCFFLNTYPVFATIFLFSIIFKCNETEVYPLLILIDYLNIY